MNFIQCASRSGAFALGALILIASLPGIASARRPIDERGQVSPNGRVDIENLAGSVRVEGWDRNEVAVTGSLADDAEEFLFEADDRRTRIEVVFPSRSRNLRNADSDLVVRVPVGSRVRVATVSATIQVSGVMGTVALQSVSGEVSLAGPSGPIDAETVSGAIEISAASPEIDASSVSGNLTLEVVCEDVSASTVSGGIESMGGVFESADFSTVSGSIRFSGAPARSGALDFDCHSGSLTVVFPADLSAEIDASTFSGDIDNGFGPKARRTNDYAPGKDLRFRVGDGEARISLSTFSGRIRMSLE